MALSDEEIAAIARRVAAEAAPAIAEIVAKKIELTFGVNCHSEEARADTRKDMEWLRESRLGTSLKAAEEDHLFIRAFRTMIEKAVWRAGTTVVVAAISGLLVLAGIGWKPEMFGK